MDQDPDRAVRTGPRVAMAGAANVLPLGGREQGRLSVVRGCSGVLTVWGPAEGA